MADIALSDISYTQQGRGRKRQGRKEVRFLIEFGDGVLTYPSGGVPIAKASLGLPVAIDSMNIYDGASANGLVYKYDSQNEKIRIYEGDYAQAGDAPLVELDAASDAPAAADLYVEAVGY